MKSLAVTVLLLLCILTLSVLNHVYVSDAVREMKELLNSLPAIDDASCHAYAEQIDTYWAEREQVLKMSIAYPLIDRVCEQASLLVACAEIRDVYGFHGARALLYDALEDLMRAERISL